MDRELSLPPEFVYIAESSANPIEMLMKLKYEYTYEDVHDILEFMEVQKLFRIEKQKAEDRNANR